MKNVILISRNASVNFYKETNIIFEDFRREDTADVLQSRRYYNIAKTPNWRK